MKLILPDKKRCQAELPNGINFMTLGGGKVGRVRCPNKPVLIVSETKDKLNGKMSLCKRCLLKYLEGVE